MSKKDFAQINVPRHEPKKHGSPLLPVVIVLLVIISFAAGYWLAEQQAATTGHAPKETVSRTELTTLQQQLRARTEQVSEQQTMIEQLQQQVAMWKGKAQQDAHSKVGELHFYNDLPNQSVTPAPVMEPAMAPQAKEQPVVIKAPVINKPIQPEAGPLNTSAAVKPVDNGAYKIQVASLRNRQDADALQQRLSDQGFRTAVQAADLGERGQWFRVYAGPYASKSVALQQLSALDAEAHVKGLLINDR